MHKQTITYDDLFSEEKITEDHYFHLSKADIAELQLIYRGGWDEHLKSVGNSGDGKLIIDTFKDLIFRSYGKRVGQDFDKSEEISRRFMASEAYSELFMKLMNEPTFAAEFVNGVMPKELREQAELANLHEAAKATVQGDVIVEPTTEKKATDYSRDELLAMSDEEFEKVAGKDPAKMSKESPQLLEIAYLRKVRRNAG